MKRNLLIAFTLVVSLMACKKDKPPVPEVEERKPDVVVKAITEKLAAADSISTFTAALKTMNLTAAETVEGITVFAPLNDDAGAPGKVGRVSASGTSMGMKLAAADDIPQLVLSEAVMRDHIVRGIFKLADLTDGRVLTGLSGKQLKVSRSGDVIWINGVQIGGKEIVNTNNEVVYTVKSVLTATTVTDDLQSTSIEVTVWDATQWAATTKPKGAVLAGATVVLYHTQQNYADSVEAFSAVSDASGKALFKSITPGTYYIKVMSGAKSNIFNRSAKQGGLYTGYASAGIFQNQAEITADHADGADPGDFRWLDANGDGKIDNNDRIPLPYEHTAVINGALKKVDVLIGTAKNTAPQPFTEQEFSTKLTTVENSIASWHKTLAVVDGLLSHQAHIDTVPLGFKALYASFGSYAFAPSNAGVLQIWKGGYDAIAALNELEDRITADPVSRAERLGQVRGSRAYVYLQLLTYFNNIPLFQKGKYLPNNGGAASAYSYIQSQLSSAETGLPQTSTGVGKLNRNVIRALRARAAMLANDMPLVKTATDLIINSGVYSLATDGTQWNAGNREIMWDNSANMTADVKTYLGSRATLPYMRLTEVYLMSIEANWALSQVSAAQSNYAILLQRAAKGVDPFNMDRLISRWGNEMFKEGGAFPNLIRWGAATAYLGRFGFVLSKNARLPIPQQIMDQNPDVLPNPGY
jgi:hypothetical protein